MQPAKNISPYKEGLRDKILDTAIAAFARNGIRAVTMDSVAAELAISKRTLYELYARKEDLLFEGLKKLQEENQRKMEQDTEQCKNVMEIMLYVYRQKVEEFRRTNPNFFTDLSKYPRVLRLLQQENKRSRSRFQRFMRRGIEEGYFRDEVNYELAGRLFDALGRYIMVNQLYRQYPIEEIFNNLIFVSMRGFCTEKGVKALDRMI